MRITLEKKLCFCDENMRITSEKKLCFCDENVFTWAKMPRWILNKRNIMIGKIVKEIQSLDPEEVHDGLRIQTKSSNNLEKR